ncbi:tetratricopeptide repeat protein [Kitasatospora arboriphila]
MPANPSEAHWIRARWAAEQGRWEEVGEHCDGVLSHEPDALNTRRLAATAATRLGDHARAQRLYQELLEHAVPADRAGEDEEHRTVQEPDLWHLITAATANRDWAVVRSTGALIGIEFDADEGPVDEEWQMVTVRTTRANGASVDLPAVRTGPSHRADRAGARRGRAAQPPGRRRLRSGRAQRAPRGRDRARVVAPGLPAAGAARPGLATPRTGWTAPGPARTPGSRSAARSPRSATGCGPTAATSTPSPTRPAGTPACPASTPPSACRRPPPRRTPTRCCSG